MGSHVELNDTLQITTEQGFPLALDLRKHLKTPFKAGDFKGKVFEFRGKPGARIYHIPPTRCFLVHNIGSKWLYWGKILVVAQTISGVSSSKIQTTGKYVITEIYGPAYQKEMTRHESPKGKSYF